MNTFRISLVIAIAMLCGNTFAEEMDKELETLATKLAVPIKEHGTKKVAVIDFTDLQGAGSELGRYIAEQLTINLVMSKRDFAVLDRANLKKLLAEHKLTAQGLIDPENAKKLGMFAGVDALVLGTIIPKGSNTTLTAKIITTETAEIIGAARAEFHTDETVQRLVSKPSTDSGGGRITDGPGVTKTYGDVRVELQSLRIVNGNQFLLTMSLANQNQKKSVWVALGTDSGANVKAFVTDSNGTEFRCASQSTSGIEATMNQNGEFFHATEIKPGDTISVVTKFFSFYSGVVPAAGDCNLRLELLIGKSFNGNYGSCTAQNVVVKLSATN